MDNVTFQGLQQDNFAPVDKGVAQGMDWAHKQAEVDLQKQMNDYHMQNLQEQKRQFNVTVGGQLYNDMTEIATLPNDELKKAKLQSLEQFAQDSQIPIHTEWFAALKDKNLAPKWADLMQSMGDLKVKNPDGFQTAMEGMRALVGNKPSMAMFEQFASAAKALSVAQIGAQSRVTSAEIGGEAKVETGKLNVEASNNRFYAGKKSRDTKAALSELDTGLKQPLFQLNGAQRIQDLVTDAKAGKFKTNGQFLSSLTQEFARMERQSNIIAEGSERKQAVESFKQDLGQFFQKIVDSPEDTVNPEWIKQLSSQMDTMKQSYMQQIDGIHSATAGGWKDIPAAQQAIDNKMKAIRKNYAGSKVFGKWMGTNQDGVDAPAAKEKPAPVKPQEKPKVDAEIEKKANQYKGMIAIAKTPQEKQALIDSAKKVLPKEKWADVGVQ